MKILAFCLLALLAASTAHAQTSVVEKQKRLKAKEAYEAGERAFRLGDLTIAAERFKESYTFYPAPLLLFNLAQVHRQAGDLEKAAYFFKQYLAATEPENRDRAEAERRLAEVEKQLEERRRARTEETPDKPKQAPVEPRPSTNESITKPAPSGGGGGRGLLIGGGALLGLGLVGLGIGGAGAALASSAADDLTAATRAMETFDAAKEQRGKNMQTLSIVGFAIGGVSIVTGSALVAIGVTRRSRR